MGIKTFLKLDDNFMERFNITDENLVYHYGFGDDYDENNFNEAKHRLYVGQALGLVERMFVQGQYNYAEIQGAVEHLFVCLKAKKLKLDMDKSKKINNIEDLRKVYPKTHITWKVKEVES